MSELPPNRFVSRRGFVGGLAGAASLTALAAFGASRPKPTNPFAYDVRRFLVTDPQLLRYTEQQVFATPHPRPRAIALAPDGHLFVAADKYVSELKPDGTLLGEFALTEEARCLAVADDALYVGFRQRVEVFDRKGGRRATWEALPEKVYLTSLAVGANDVFAADAGRRMVLRYDRSGQLRGRIGERDPARNVPGFIVPSPFFAVRLGADGLLRVTNPGRHRVEVYTTDGDLEQSWGRAGAAIEHFCGCCNPVALTLLADGRVVTFEKGIPRVKLHEADGAFAGVVAGAESFAENARVCGPNDCTLGGLDGVADAAGRIYILDLVAANVRVMEPKDRVEKSPS